MKKIFAIIAALTLAGCLTSDEEAIETLEKAGFTNIKPKELNEFFG